MGSFIGFFAIILYIIIIGGTFWLFYRGVKALETIAAKMKDHRTDL